MHSIARGQRLALTALAAGVLLSAAQANAAVNSGSTGADGVLSPGASVELPLPANGILNYTSVNIPKGVTVTFRKNPRNTPVVMLVSGNVKIEGVIDIRGAAGKPTGTAGDGSPGDDGEPGTGGPGGFDGGRGGREDASLRPEIISGGGGQGPGGGPGGVKLADCTPGTAYSRVYVMGGGGGHSVPAYRHGTTACGPVSNVGATFYGRAYGSDRLQPLLGGSGGGGGLAGTAIAGSGGGGGGGALLIAADGTIEIIGEINANGGNAGAVGGSNGNAGSPFWGAGGSGGAIRLVATKITGAGKLTATGGCGGDGNVGCQWDGSGYDSRGPLGNGGAPGRIRLETEALGFTVATTPSYVLDKPAPLFAGNLPSLRIASVAGVEVPLDASVAADVSLPTPPAGAVTVVLKAVNVPVGKTVLLRVAAAYGAVKEASAPLTGSEADGTASVSVDLPAGPSTLTATATYTVPVPVAAAAALSSYANAEHVDQIELTVALQGEPQVRLITTSGKRVELSYAQLLAAGFHG